jgi:hypothetical protein
VVGREVMIVSSLVVELDEFAGFRKMFSEGISRGNRVKTIRKIIYLCDNVGRVKVAWKSRG